MKKVLVVDDAMLMRNTLRRMLEKNGYEVIGEAENGEIAIAKYFSLQPDIVTMDMTMPELDGISALKIIKNNDNNAKVVMISAMGQELMVKDAILAGAKAFIVKPFKENHVIETLNRL